MKNPILKALRVWKRTAGKGNVQAMLISHFFRDGTKTFIEVRKHPYTKFAIQTALRIGHSQHVITVY